MAKAKTDALQLKWGCSRETAIYIRALENRVRHLHGACEDLGNAASEKGLCTRIWINPHTKRFLKGTYFGSAGRPNNRFSPEWPINRGLVVEMALRGRNDGASATTVLPALAGGWMPENISGIPAGRSVFRLTSPLIGHSHSDGDCGCQIGQNC